MLASKRPRLRGVLALALALCGTGPAWATPSLVVDVDSGNVLHQQEATSSWYPASLTKLMTAYVALHAVKEGKISLDTPLVVSSRAARAAPSKMGFRPGIQVTLDNALKMLMVKSANDIAITIAEGVSGSVEGFATEMNTAAARLGMHESYFDNPNGLPDERQVTSARDMAVVGRALYTEFPDHADLFGIGALQFGRQIIQTHNGLLGRYPGVDGGKTGFTCSAGFNVVASATRGSRHLIVVVLGASSVRARNVKAAELLDAAFSGSERGSDSLTGLSSNGVEPAPNMRDEACGPHARFVGEDAEDPALANHPAPSGRPAGREMVFQSIAPLRPAIADDVMAVLSPERPRFNPVPVFIGPAPGWTGSVAGPTTPDPTVAYAADKASPSAAAAAATAAAGPARLSGAKSLRVHSAKAVLLPRAHAKRIAQARPTAVKKQKHPVATR